MDSIEERYCTLKSITGITLVIGLIIAFGHLLSIEAHKLELLIKAQMRRNFKKF